MSNLMNYYQGQVSRFIDDWSKRNQPPIAFMITGGGFSLVDIGKVPGASSVLSSVYIPYGMADSEGFAHDALEDGEVNPLSDGSIKFVGPEATELYSLALKNTCQHNSVIQIVINASLTTNRWRRGDNEAYIWIRGYGGKGSLTKFHYKMKKLSEEEYDKLSSYDIRQIRLEEDIRIAQAVMGLISIEENRVSSYSGETLEKIEDTVNENVS